MRPILDAVLAMLPALGQVTVQARRTEVSLVCPRRTFAWVQPMSKRRVELRLRLADAGSTGRPATARDIAEGIVRVSLTGPGDVGEEVFGLLRRAYQENTAPPPPRRPARHPAPKLGPLTVVIEGYDPPGLTCQPGPDGTVYRSIHVALSGPGNDRPALEMPGQSLRACEPVPGDSPRPAGRSR